MPLFKDQVALEACPAKTAESVSYGATFAVLGWLVLSNYSGMGYAGSDTVASAEPDAAELGQSTGYFDFDAAPSGSPVWNAAAENEIASEQLLASSMAPEVANLEKLPDTHPYTRPADLAAWHAILQPQPQPSHHSRSNEFSAASWREVSPNKTELTLSYSPELLLPWPLIDSDTFRFIPSDSDRQLQLNNGGTAIREITVTGSEGERLVARPDNIQRPQLPRPYRAQEIQRNIVLPPRIQALRP